MTDFEHNVLFQLHQIMQGHGLYSTGKGSGTVIPLIVLKTTVAPNAWFFLSASFALLPRSNIAFKGTRLGEAFLGVGYHQRRGVALASELARPLI